MLIAQRHPTPLTSFDSNVLEGHALEMRGTSIEGHGGDFVFD